MCIPQIPFNKSSVEQPCRLFHLSVRENAALLVRRTWIFRVMCTLTNLTGRQLYRDGQGTGRWARSASFFRINEPKKTGSRISARVRSAARINQLIIVLHFLIIHAYKYPGTHRKVMIQKAVVLHYGTSSPTHPFPWLSH